jgi:DNA (cytosine-5)-methyltransferase 1
MLFVRNGVEVDRHGKKAGKGALIATEEAPTLDAGNHWALFQPQAFRKAARAQSVEDDESWVADGQANTLNTFDMGDTRTTHAIVEPTNYGVRRLTPVECERLQAFPDGWTEPAVSDSARYKALGNAVTVNTVRWVLGRMLEQS